MIKKSLLIANWKMNKTGLEAGKFIRRLKVKIKNLDKVKVVICPPFTALSSVAEEGKNSSLAWGGQNMFWQEKGSYTGEISPKFLKELGCQYVILGHSERRRYFGESDELINKKVLAALKFKLTPILCLGEKLSERENKQTFSVIKKQLKIGLKGVSKFESMIIAYEPLWAIGSGKTASAKQIAEINVYIRKFINQKYDFKTSLDWKVIYGGSVKPTNISQLVREKEINGFLVGGASLKLDSFLEMIKKANV